MADRRRGNNRWCVLSTDMVDVAVIGAGVVGCAIARELSNYDLRVAVVEAAVDVGSGTSKANTSILHTGFDAPPGSLEARLVRRGYHLLTDHAARTGIPLEKIGALLIAWDENQLESLASIADRARENDYRDATVLSAAELYELEPNLGQGVLGGLAVPDEGIVCTFSTTLAFAYEAVENGVELHLSSRVQAVQTVDGAHVLELAGAEPELLSARWVINAAGLEADTVDRFFNQDRFTVKPRRGELIVFDKFARSLVGHVLLPVPTEKSKGVLVAPTVFGNVLLGPTADDVEDKRDTGSTAGGISRLLEHGQRILPALVREEVTAIYAGLRASIGPVDYRIELDAEASYVCIAGIRSTGLTSSMAIAEHVRVLLGEAGLPLQRSEQHIDVRLPPVGESMLRRHQDPEAIALDEAYGRIVCHCERVTAGEIRDSFSAPVPATDVDGVRRRTRAQLGRCQGFYCSAALAALVDDARAVRAG